MTPFFKLKDIASMPDVEFESPCRQYTSYAYLDNNIALCRVLTKYKIFVDTRNSEIVPYLVKDGFLEPCLTKFLTSIVKKGDICIDVGANFGYYTVLMSALSGNNGRVIAIEHDKTIACVLENTSGLNDPAFEVSKSALFDAGDNAALTSLSGSLRGRGMIRRGIRAQLQTAVPNIQVTLLDILMKEFEIGRVDVVKIDVKGAAPLVLKKMESILKTNGQIKIILKYSPQLYTNVKAFTKYLFKNFEVFSIKNAGEMIKLKKNSISGLINIEGHVNVYLLKKKPLKRFFSFITNGLL